MTSSFLVWPVSEGNLGSPYPETRFRNRDRGEYEAEGRVLEGAERVKALSDCLKRPTEALRGLMQPAEDAVCDWHWKAVR